MTALTHALSTQGAQIRNALARLAQGFGETFAMLDAAIRVSHAIERRQRPDPSDMKVLGLKEPLPRMY